MVLIAQKRNPGSCQPQAAEEGLPRSTSELYTHFSLSASMNHTFFQGIEAILDAERLAVALDRYTNIRRQGLNPWLEKIRQHWPQS